MRLTLSEWRAFNTPQFGKNRGPLAVPIGSILPITPAVETVVMLNADSGGSGLELADEWLGVAGIVQNVEKIAVEAGAARGLILALRQAAESTSHLFPRLESLSIERVIFLDTVDELSVHEPSGGLFSSSIFERPTRPDNVDTLFVALLNALQLRIASGYAFHLVLRRCSLTMDMVLSLRCCLGAESLEWDGELDGARRYTSSTGYTYAI
ncbi:hypothetical protein BV25DRAFT_1833330 [Artomyces pyxidatus]|uniref:Uncharacterized protein n=1 Tax=Artomyces pyxidatus TaxID=48021 RepID=A0ACB8SHN0_9AGAM|nr:hypothetical protein BV25DRAFT_1833330 [Artomyces pyxidatus]